MTDRTRRIVVFGDVFDDILVTPSGRVRSDTDTLASIERRPGGSAANTAAWLGASGAFVDFVGRVNDADVGRHEAALRSAGVNPRLIGDPVHPTGTIVVIVENDGAGASTRTMLTERGANSLTSPADVTDSLLASARHVHFTGYTIFSGQPTAGFRSLIERAHAQDVTVSVDPGSSGFLADHGAELFLSAVDGADILFPNEDEAIALAAAIGLPAGLAGDSVTDGAILETLTTRFPLVALTLGRSGASVATSSAHGTAGAIRVSVPCTPVEPRDTTGAGDAFNAGFLSALFASPGHPLAVDHGLEERLAAAAAHGVATAATAITVVGARPEPL